MANLILAHGGLTAGASVSASTEAGSSFAAANVITRQPSERLRFTGCASEWLQVVLAQPASIDLLALVGNFSPFAEIDILAADHAELLPETPAWSVTGLLDPAMPADPSAWPTVDLNFLTDQYTVGFAARSRIIRVHLPASALTYRAWRFVLRDPCNPAGYLDVNRALLAAKWQPVRNLAFGRDLSLVDDSRTEFTMGGAARSTELGRRRSMSFTVPYGPDGDMLVNAVGLDEAVGTVKEVLLLQDPAATIHFQRLSLYGRLTQMLPVQNVTTLFWSKRFQLEELV